MPPNAEQIRVSARHLYPYVGNNYPSLWEWVDSLRRVVDDPNNSIMGFRVFYDGEKGVNSTLNLNLSTFLIDNSSHYATGAVARVILAEALQGASHGHLDHINLTLAEYQCLGSRCPGYVYPLALHLFLRVQTPFEYWFDCQKKNLRLRCGRDYYRFCGGRSYWNENGPGELYFDDITAERVIKATQTFRGQCALRQVE